ncbi:MAG: aldehyde ferredoxin oxidoreductase C-terminal domain-containing protein [Chloroflexota bacterium]|nr:aldehyde ferredoxin oxidoreductase C-terminal domain-containing protein [Chloroflexota bacterium]
MNSYTGKTLYVDVGTGATREEPVDPEVQKQFIGSEGISAYFAYDLLTPGIDPLSPEYPIIICSSALSGTMAPGTSRFVSVCKAPATGNITYATAGGTLAARLKYAGYDNLIISGKADKLSCLTIFDDKIEMVDAGDLKGKDTFETTELLWDKYGDDCSVLCIGLAGENKVKISFGLVDQISTLGKDGTGAIMGAKNLKAVVVRGTKGVGVADTKGFRQVVKRALERVKADKLYEPYRALGFGTFQDALLKDGNMLFTKNYREAFPEHPGVEMYGADVIKGNADRYMACFGCPMGCKMVSRIKEGEFAGLETTAGSSPIPSITWGMRYPAGDYSKALKLFDMCQKHGIDALLMSSMLMWLEDLYANGVITEKDTDGIIPKPSYESAAQFIEKTVKREGIGDILADGFLGAIEKIGRGSEKYALLFKGLDPEVDARIAFGTEAFAQLTRHRGGSPPAESFTITINPGIPGKAIVKWGVKRSIIPETAIERVSDAPSGWHVGRYTRYTEDWGTMMTCMGFCLSPYIGRSLETELVMELYQKATGDERTFEELLVVGERTWNVIKALNTREGRTRKDDKMPERVLDEKLKWAGKELPLMDYGQTKELTEADVEELLDGYYDERGWDLEKGLPTKQKLTELGLQKMAEDLEKRGLIK